MPDMSENSQPSKTSAPTPEQLLKLLDLQIAASRSRRRETPRRRALVAVGAILFIILGALAALLILQQMVADLPRGPRSAEPAAGVQKSQ